MKSLQKGRYRADFVAEPSEFEAVLNLRSLVFRGPGSQSSDQDRFDENCQHVSIRLLETGQVVGCFRVMLLASGADIGRSYSAQFYDLTGLQSVNGPLLELGRFCIHPDFLDPDILRLAWGFLTGVIDRKRVEILFGCSSFAGVEPQKYRDGFALLGKKYLAPADCAPGVKTAEIYRFDHGDPVDGLDLRRALNALPPLLRTYLLMGGWVSDHAVIDRDLHTMHVFTCLNISAIPKSRAQRLRDISE